MRNNSVFLIWFGIFFVDFGRILRRFQRKTSRFLLFFWQAQKSNLCIKTLIFKVLCNFKWYDNQQNPQNCSKKSSNL